jgi:hypothetical protein
MVSRCCICFAHTLQVFYLDVAYVCNGFQMFLSVFCKYFRCMFQVFRLSSFVYWKCLHPGVRSPRRLINGTSDWLRQPPLLLCIVQSVSPLPNVSAASTDVCAATASTTSSAYRGCYSVLLLPHPHPTPRAPRLHPCRTHHPHVARATRSLPSLALVFVLLAPPVACAAGDGC